jgi:hypothetical protein
MGNTKTSTLLDWVILEGYRKWRAQALKFKSEDLIPVPSPVFQIPYAFTNTYIYLAYVPPTFLYGWHYTSLLRYLLTYLFDLETEYIPLLTAFTTPTFGTGLSPSLCFIVFPLYLSVLIAYCSDPLLALAFATFVSCTIQPILIAALFCCCFCFAGYVPACLDWLIQWNNSTLDKMHEPSLPLITKFYWFPVCVL